MNEDRLMELIQKNGGFELTIGFCDDEDHFIGGTGNTVWYYIQKGSKAEFWEGIFKDGKWTDKHYVKKGKGFSDEEAGSGISVTKAADRLFFGQDYILKDGRKPSIVEQHGIMVEHYAYNFGELAYEVSQEYGVTVSYSNINDVKAGYHMRTLKVGADVEIPKK